MRLAYESFGESQFRNHSLPLPRIVTIKSFAITVSKIVIVLSHSKNVNPKTKAKIMNYLTKNPRCFVEEIVEGTGVSRAEVYEVYEVLNEYRIQLRAQAPPPKATGRRFGMTS